MRKSGQERDLTTDVEKAAELKFILERARTLDIKLIQDKVSSCGQCLLWGPPCIGLYRNICVHVCSSTVLATHDKNKEDILRSIIN